MNRSLLLPLAGALVLSAAAPAGALTSEGIPAKLVAPKPAAVAAAKSSSSAKTHTCQAGDTKEKAKARTTIVGSAKKTAVVACEQPPRSQLIGAGLKHAAANALAALG
jgi:hypothetical protein